MYLGFFFVLDLFQKTTPTYVCLFWFQAKQKSLLFLQIASTMKSFFVNVSRNKKLKVCYMSYFNITLTIIKLHCHMTCLLEKGSCKIFAKQSDKLFPVSWSTNRFVTLINLLSLDIPRFLNSSQKLVVDFSRKRNFYCFCFHFTSSKIERSHFFSKVLSFHGTTYF